MVVLQYCNDIDNRKRNGIQSLLAKYFGRSSAKNGPPFDVIDWKLYTYICIYILYTNHAHKIHKTKPCGYSMGYAWDICMYLFFSYLCRMIWVSGVVQESILSLDNIFGFTRRMCIIHVCYTWMNAIIIWECAYLSLLQNIHLRLD